MRILRWLSIVMLGSCALWAQQTAEPAPSLTIYNQDFAVVRQQLRLDLRQGQNNVRYDGMTAQLEPDSVVLRDPTGKRMLQIYEQNYQADPVSQQSLLELFTGKQIEFQVAHGDKNESVQGTILRPGRGMPRINRVLNQSCYQLNTVGCEPEEPLIQMDGKLMFGLPGKPVFPALPQDTNLNPTLQWIMGSDRGGPLDAELSYVTGGLTWEADYNVVAPPKGDNVEVIGWVTMQNSSGKTFNNANIKLMAGDVNKVQPSQGFTMMKAMAAPMAGGMGGGVQGPPVTEKPFDEYHLYTLSRPTTLRDRETKQVEFVRAENIATKHVYVYDGSRLDPARAQYQNWEYLRFQREVGTQSNTKVWVMEEFKNTEANRLGMALPKGRLRFYRQDDSGALQFIGENTIDHTAKDETIRVYTGNAFDMAAERRRTNFRSDQQQAYVDESFEIKLRNHKREPVDVTIVEHLYRGSGWEITSSSTKYNKKDSSSVEFPVTVPADGEQTVIYTVHYSW